jgi:hypothetical protein
MSFYSENQEASSSTENEFYNLESFVAVNKDSIEVNREVTDLAKQAILKLSLNEFQALQTVFRIPKSVEAEHARAIFDSVHNRAETVESRPKKEEFCEESHVKKVLLRRDELSQTEGRKRQPTTASPTTDMGPRDDPTGRSEWDKSLRAERKGIFTRTTCKPGFHTPKSICSHTIREHLKTKSCFGNRCKKCTIVVVCEQYSLGVPADSIAIDIKGNFVQPNGIELARVCGKQPSN